MDSIIKVSEQINSPAALTVEQGGIIYNCIISALNAGNSVVLDFSDIESIITPFLNESIGKLYENFTSDELNEHLKIVNQPEGTGRKFNMVIRNAKQFYANQKEYTEIVKKVLDE